MHTAERFLNFGEPTRMLAEKRLPVHQRIRRIRAQVTIGLAALVALWLCICAFVIVAMWLRWKL